MENAWCPKCDREVSIESPWGDVVCPICGLEGYWEEAMKEGFCIDGRRTLR